MEDKSPRTESAGQGAKVPGMDDVMLFMPEATFAEMHGQATRLGLTDTAFLTGCWRAARERIATDPTSPQLGSRSSGSVYLSLASPVHEDALKFAESQGRSVSWAFLKAWAMARTEVLALSSAEQFSAWAQTLQQAPLVRK